MCLGVQTLDALLDGEQVAQSGEIVERQQLLVFARRDVVRVEFVEETLLKYFMVAQLQSDIVNKAISFGFVLIGVAVLFALDALDGRHGTLDNVAVAQRGAYRRLALGTLGQRDRVVVAASIGLVAAPDPLVHAGRLDNVSTVGQEDKASIGLVFVAEEDVRHCFPMANATHWRTRLAAQANARMAAPFQLAFTRLVARLTIARLVTLACAFCVLAFPRAILFARHARIGALEWTLGVHTPGLASSHARLALCRTRRLTLIDTIKSEKDVRNKYSLTKKHF